MSEHMSDTNNVAAPPSPASAAGSRVKVHHIPSVISVPVASSGPRYPCASTRPPPPPTSPRPPHSLPLCSCRHLSLTCHGSSDRYHALLPLHLLLHHLLLTSLALEGRETYWSTMAAIVAQFQFLVPQVSTTRPLGNPEHQVTA